MSYVQLQAQREKTPGSHIGDSPVKKLEQDIHEKCFYLWSKPS